ncbi:MAG: TetR/AcrR family transcriptional regulator [Candidatus Cloacimonetes bacterium]|nr:TetR/AcrR family transcriptional regulator [Candidatus Cloacimonadota bacterium]
MQVLKDDVRSEILRQARREFLEKGFRLASLREIAGRAGMTAGNIYRYFKSKDELFRELLAPIIGNIEMMKLNLRKHDQETPKGSGAEVDEHKAMIVAVYGFIMKYREDLKLLLTGAGGSSLEGFKEELIRWYGEIYMKALQEAWQIMGEGDFKINARTVYLISQSVADSLIEAIVNEYSLQEVIAVAEEMQSFFEGGTQHILKAKLISKKTE